MKTHNLAAFTGAIKVAFGFVHPGQRRWFHASRLQEKLAEVTLCRQPDLVLMDGRVAFITRGPAEGTRVAPGIIMASGDPVAIDVEGIRSLLVYKADNKLPANPWQLPQMAHAVKLGFCNIQDYILVEAKS